MYSALSLIICFSKLLKVSFFLIQGVKILILMSLTASKMSRNWFWRIQKNQKLRFWWKYFQCLHITFHKRTLYTWCTVTWYILKICFIFSSGRIKKSSGTKSMIGASSSMWSLECLGPANVWTHFLFGNFVLKA